MIGHRYRVVLGVLLAATMCLSAFAGNKAKKTKGAKSHAPVVTVISPDFSQPFPTNDLVVDVTVQFSTEGTGNCKTIQLVINGTVVASFDNPANVKEGTHTFEGVDLEPYLGEAVTLSAVAYQGSTNAPNGGSDPDADGAGGTIQVDQTPPVLTAVSPVAGAVLMTGTPTIEASYTDELSGVDPAAVVLTVDGTDVSSLATITAGGISYVPGTALADGTHTVQLSASDKAGNAADSIQWSFTTDTTPPVVSGFTPADGSILADNSPTVSASLADATSGLGADTISLHVDGEAVEAVFADGVLSYAPAEGLEDGLHAVQLDVSDIAGNATSVTWSFMTDTVKPTVTPTVPLDGSILNTPVAEIAASYADTTSGINVSSVVMRINGESVPASATVSGATYTPETPLGPDEYAVSVEVADLAGNTETWSWFFTVDTAPPVVDTVLPQDGTLTGNNTTGIQVSLGDDISGVNPDTFVLQVNGDDVSAGVQANATEAGYRFTWTPQTPYADGTVNVSVQCADKAGNVLQHASSFTVDTTPPPTPALRNATDPITTREDQVVFEVLTSADTESLVVQCATAMVASVARTGNAGADLVWTVTLTTLDEGDNAVTLTASDEVGNASDPLEITVKLDEEDTEPPILLSIEPVSGSTFDTRTITVFGTAKNHAYAKTIVNVYRIGGSVPGGTLVSTTEAPAGEMIAGPDEDGLSTWEWSVENVKLGRGQNRVEVIGEDESGNQTVSEVYYTLNPFMNGLGTSGDIPLNEGVFLCSMWVRDPQDIVSHRLRVSATATYDWGDGYVDEWDYQAVNTPTNMGEADFNYIFYEYKSALEYGYADMELSDVQIEYTVTYAEPNGETSTYTTSSTRAVVVPDEDDDEPVAFKLQVEDLGHGAANLTIVPKDETSAVTYYVSGKANTLSRVRKFLYLYHDIGWQEDTQSVELDTLTQPIGQTVGWHLDEMFECTENRLRTYVMDEMGNGYLVDETFQIEGAPEHTLDPSQINMIVSPMQDDAVQLTYPMNPNGYGSSFVVSGMMPQEPHLSGKASYSNMGWYTRASRHRYLHGLSPVPVTMLQLVDGGSGQKLYHIYFATSPKAPTWKIQDGNLTLTPGIRDDYSVNTRTMRSKGWRDDTQFVIYKDCTLTVPADTGAWLAFGRYPSSGRAVRKGDDLTLRLWRFAPEPNESSGPATLSFSCPTSAEGTTLGARQFSSPEPSEVEIGTNDLSTGEVVVTATLDGLRTYRPDDRSVSITEYPTLTATQTFSVFTQEIRCESGTPGDPGYISQIGSIEIDEGETVSFAAEVDGADFCDQAWYIDPIWYAERYNNKNYARYNYLRIPPYAGDGTEAVTRNFSIAPEVYYDEWYGGWYGWRPEKVVFRVQHVVWHNKGTVYEQRYERTIHVIVNKRDDLNADLVISDGAQGPESKEITYSLPYDMRKARLDLYTREADGRPVVYRNALSNPEMSKGVHGPVSMADRFGVAIGEDCWAKITATDYAGYYNVSDQLWRVHHKDGGPLSHPVGAQCILLNTNAASPLEYQYAGKTPDESHLTFTASGVNGLGLAPAASLEGDFDEGAKATSINQETNLPMLLMSGDTVGTGTLAIDGATVTMDGAGDGYQSIPKNKIAQIYVGRLDLDVDADYSGEINDDDEAPEDETPGYIFKINDDNDDFADEPEDALEVDNTNDRIDGEDDLEDMKILKARFELPEDVPGFGTVRIMKAGDARVRIFFNDGEDGVMLLDPEADDQYGNNATADLSEYFKDKTEIDFLMEGVTTGPLSLTLVYENEYGLALQPDEVKLNPIQMQFVVKGENGEIVPSEFVGVSDPRPVVENVQFELDSIGANDSHATLRFTATVHDAVADNIPAGAGADIGSLAVTVDGEDAGAVPLTRLPEGDAALPDPSFWVQHPHKEVIDTESGWAEAQIPLTEGTHIVRLETAENAADNTGFAEVAVTLTKQEIPGAGDPTTDPDGNAVLTMNLFIPEDTTSAAADTAVFYWGERDPILPPDENADPQLAEAAGEESSLTFKTLLDTGATLTVTVKEVYDAATDEWQTPANGELTFDDTTTEKLKANATYTFPEGGTMRFEDLVMTETETGSRVMRAGVEVVTEPDGDGGGGVVVGWTSAVEEREVSDAGFYAPVTLRIKGLPDLSEQELEEYSFEVNGVAMKLEKEGEWYYLKGGSKWIMDATEDPKPGKKKGRLWDDKDEDGAIDKDEVSPIDLTEGQFTAFFTKGTVTLAVGDATVLTVDLDVDANRDGNVTDDAADDEGEDRWEYGAGKKGAIILCNNDNDDKAAGDTEIDNDNSRVDGANDVNDLATLVLRKPKEPLPPGCRLRLCAFYPDKIRIFDEKAVGATAVLEPASAHYWYELPSIPTADLEYGMEAIKYADKGFNGLIRLRLELVSKNGPTITTDTVQVRVAPWVMPHTLNAPRKVYTVEVKYDWTDPTTGIQYKEDNGSFVSALSKVVAAAGATLQTITGDSYRTNPAFPPSQDRWIQDEIEFGHSKAPFCEQDVVFDSPRDRGLKGFPEAELLGKNMGWITYGTDDGTLNSFGNLEVSPPVTIGTKEYKLGRIIYGGSTTQKVDDKIREFLAAQKVQTPIEIDTTWLTVKHADECISFVPSNGAKKFKLLISSPKKAMDILNTLNAAGKGQLKLFDGKETRDGIPIDLTVSDIVTDTTLTEYSNLPSADLRDFNDKCQKHLDAIETKLKQELNLTDADIVDVPVIFIPYEEGGTFYDIADALSPNMTNLVVLGNHLAIPKPFGPVDGGKDQFEKYMQDKMSSMGLNCLFINNWDWYHLIQGENHCGTNVLREVPPSVRWWE